MESSGHKHCFPHCLIIFQMNEPAIRDVSEYININFTENSYVKNVHC